MSCRFAPQTKSSQYNKTLDNGIRQVGYKTVNNVKLLGHKEVGQLIIALGIENGNGGFVFIISLVVKTSVLGQ